MVASCPAALLLLAGAAVFVGGSRVTPTEKVISLLTDLKHEVMSEGSGEATVYDAFACFCKDTTSTKSASILTEEFNIDGYTSDITLKTASKISDQSDRTTRQGNAEKLAAELEETHATYLSAQTDYNAEAQDMSKAISSLEGAQTSMEASKNKPVVLLQVPEDISKSLALAEAMGLIEAPKRAAISSFLQQAQGAKVNPAEPGYGFHSQEIIDLVTTLLGDFTKQKSDLDTEWGKTTTTYNSAVSSLNLQITANDAAISQLNIDIDAFETQIATARTNLITSEGTMKDDQTYLKQLTARCEQRAQDWDQRSALRGDEITALSEALRILNDKVQPMDQAANERALLQVVPVQKVHKADVTANMTHSTAASKKSVSFLQLGRGHAVLSMEQRKDKAIALLETVGKRIGSSNLAALVMRGTLDPFKKVKGLIQKLIERLLKESAAEATKKGFCDTELGKAKTDRKHYYEDATKLLAELGSLEVKFDELSESIAMLTTEIAQLNVDLTNATTLRADEKAENVQTIEQATAGLSAIKDAITVLKVFYRKSSRAKVLLQRHSPVDDDTAGAGFQGEYKGKQDSATGIIGLLEVIKSDFERTLKVTKSEEKKGASEFVKFDRTSQADIAGKTTKQELDQEDLITTNNTITDKYSDLETTQDLLDKSLEALEALNPMCVDSTMSYADRVQKREDEMDALKRALCILDTNQVETDECTTTADGWAYQA